MSMEAEQRRLRDIAERGPPEPSTLQRSWQDFTRVFKKVKLESDRVPCGASHLCGCLWHLKRATGDFSGSGCVSCYRCYCCSFGVPMQLHCLGLHREILAVVYCGCCALKVCWCVSGCCFATSERRGFHRRRPLYLSKLLTLQTTFVQLLPWYLSAHRIASVATFCTFPKCTVAECRTERL